MRKEKVAILGGSRGLGAALVQHLKQRGHDVFMISRQPSAEVAATNWAAADFSQKLQWPSVVQKIKDSQSEVLIYCAGGGPFGKFGDKAWRDQEWSWTVTFECPAYLAWQMCRAEALPGIKKLIIIGSAVAEAQPDANAAMYCASKHALRGLLDTLKLEYPEKEIHLFKAPYMDTDLLPPGAWPRQKPGLVQAPENVAQDLVKTLLG